MLWHGEGGSGAHLDRDDHVVGRSVHTRCDRLGAVSPGWRSHLRTRQAVQKSARTAEGHDAGGRELARSAARAGGHDAPSSRRMWARQGRRASQEDAQRGVSPELAQPRQCPEKEEKYICRLVMRRMYHSSGLPHILQVYWCNLHVTGQCQQPPDAGSHSRGGVAGPDRSRM